MLAVGFWAGWSFRPRTVPPISPPPLHVGVAVEAHGDIPASANRPWPNRSGVDTLPELEGRTPREVIAELGSPVAIAVFRPDEANAHYQDSIRDVHPPDQGNAGSLWIAEFRWKYPGLTVVVWFHTAGGQWVVLHSLRWQDGVKF